MPWGNALEGQVCPAPLIQAPFPHSDFLLSIHVAARRCLLCSCSSHPSETNHPGPQQTPRSLTKLASGMPTLRYLTPAVGLSSGIYQKPFGHSGRLG